MNWALSAGALGTGPGAGSYQLPTNPDAKLDSRMVDLNTIKLVDYDFAKTAALKELTARFDAEVAAQPKE